MVHVLGNSTDLNALTDFVAEHELLLLEDTCESLGSTHRGKMLGSLGDFGTFSFYFSHHMTTIEGGMVLAKSEEDYDLLKCLRAHGWSREQSNRAALESANQHIDPRFLFVNVGYNLRPMEIQAAFGIEQLTRLDEMNRHRRANVLRIREAFVKHPAWREQLLFPTATAGLDACWFGFPFLVNSALDLDYRQLHHAVAATGDRYAPYRLRQHGAAAGGAAFQRGPEHGPVYRRTGDSRSRLVYRLPCTTAGSGDDCTPGRIDSQLRARLQPGDRDRANRARGSYSGVHRL